MSERRPPPGPPTPLTKPAEWLGRQVAKALALSDNEIELDRHRIELDPLGWLCGKLHAETEARAEAMRRTLTPFERAAVT